MKNKNQVVLALAAAVSLGMSGSVSAGLIFSEIMYNPASAEDDWEWVEVFNSGAASIDLSGYVFDDINSLAHGSANIASGSIAAGSAAVLFNADDITTTDFANSWGGGINLIGVSNWTDNKLNNGGDTISLWSSFASYSGDHTTHANAILTQAYDDSGLWPSDNGSSSIYLPDLTADAATGSNWALSTAGVDGAYASSGTSGATDVASPYAVPIPSTLALFGLGLAGLVARRRA